MQLVIKEKLLKFFSQYEKRSYLTGQIIKYPNKNISHIYFIKSGLIRQHALSPEGTKLIIHIFKPFSYIPYALYLSNPQNLYTYQAISKTETMVAPINDVDEFLKENPDVLYDLTCRMSQAFTGLLRKYEHYAFDDAGTRILSLMIYLANGIGEKRDGGIFITVPFTHVDIASWLGLQRETISRQLMAMQKIGIIKYSNKRELLIKIDSAKEELKKRSKN